MKKHALLVFGIALAALAGCEKENTSEQRFTGIDIEAGDNSSLFILNQGAFPAASTLDVLNLSTMEYTADIFAAANPDIPLGMGNTGNDMAVIGGRLWVLMNASNCVAVLDLSTGKLLRSIPVDSPRYIVLKGDYAYVSSYGAAVYGGTPAKGKVYRIGKEDFSVSSVEAGYQPEGLTVLGEKLYVANSGGFNAQKDNTVSVIDLATFTLANTLSLPVSNLCRLFTAGGKMWVSTYAIYDSSYNFVAAASLGSLDENGAYSAVEGVSPDAVSLCGNTLYAVSGSSLARVDTASGKVDFAELGDLGYVSGMAVNPSTGDIYLAQGNYTGDSRLTCLSSSLERQWDLATGTGTGPLLVY